MCQSITGNERKMYLLASELQPFKRRVKKATETVKEALSKSTNASLSFSSGKDSIVLLDIAVKAGFKGTLVFFKYGICNDIETPKENIELLKYYADLHNLNYKILDCLGEVDCWEQCGRFLFFPETESEKQIFNKTNFDFIEKSKQFEKENKVDLSIIGMRKAESKRREMVLNKNGAIYKTQSRQSVTCCPLLNFTNTDIWAYIFSNNLKYLSIYDYPYIDRRFNRNEITILYNDAIIRNGQILHYKNMYIEFFNWLENRWGKIYT